MSNNPFSFGKEQLDNIGRQFAFDIAIVEAVESTANHTVLCHLRSEAEAKFVAPMIVPASGDITMPNIGDLVIIGYTKAGQSIVLGVIYGREDNIPAHEIGERRIGHEETDAHVTIKPNGDIYVNTDGNVYINDGTDNPMIDVTTTTADGYITSVTPVTKDNVFI